MALDIQAKDEIYLRLAAHDVRRSHFIEFLPDNLIVIEQTNPGIDNHWLLSTIFFTFCPGGQKTHRVGFNVRIETITPDYRIFMTKLSEPVPCDLRFWPRIRLDLLPGVRAFCHEQEIQVIDISGGGTHVVLRENDCATPPIGTIVQMKFIFENGEETMDGEVLRQWVDPTGTRHVAVKFVGQHNIQKYIY
jgi:hypothetical protein